MILGGDGEYRDEGNIFQFQKESHTFVIIGKMQMARSDHAVTLVKTDDYVCNFEPWCILQKLSWVKKLFIVFSFLIGTKYKYQVIKIPRTYFSSKIPCIYMISWHFCWCWKLLIQKHLVILLQFSVAKVTLDTALSSCKVQ